MTTELANIATATEVLAPVSPFAQFALGGERPLIRKASAGKAKVNDKKEAVTRKIDGKEVTFAPGAQIPAIPRAEAVVGTTIMLTPFSLAEVAAQVKARGLKGREATALRTSIFTPEVNAAARTGLLGVVSTLNGMGVVWDGPVSFDDKGNVSMPKGKLPAGAALNPELAAKDAKIAKLEALLAKLTDTK